MTLSTPRVDAASQSRGSPFECVPADFARTLERELIATQKAANRYWFLKKNPGWRTYRWLNDSGYPIPRELSDAEIDAAIADDPNPLNARFAEAGAKLESK